MNDRYIDRSEQYFVDQGVPQGVVSGLEFAYLNDLINYVERGVDPQNFLTAILQNDLYQTYKKADSYNIDMIPVWVNLIYNHLPTGCRGSKRAVDDWIFYR